MKIAVIGYGSIGKRHAENIKALGHEPVIVSRHLGLGIDFNVDAVVIATETRNHIYPINVPQLIEKPIFYPDKPVSAVWVSGKPILVGYQYRHNLMLNELKRRLGELGDIEIVHAHQAQYLPDWHPGEDYTKSYAAKDGVALTLSHPLDYLRYLFGDCTLRYGYKTHGDLPIDGDTTASYQLDFGFPANVYVDYIQRPGSHWMSIQGSEKSAYWTPSSLRIWGFGEEITFNSDYDRNDDFLAEMAHFIRVIEGKDEPICTLADGIAVLEILEQLQ